MNEDLALEALLSIKTTAAPDLSVDLLRKCYELQKRHQFDHDRLPSTQAMDRMIEEEVEKVVVSQDALGIKR